MKPTILSKFPYFQLSLSQRFHNGTKIEALREETSPEDKKKWPKEWIEVNFKGYPRFRKIKLMKPKTGNNKNLYKLLIGRHSVRTYSKNGISLPDLSTLLYYSAGLRDMRPRQDEMNRFYPSAGARYPLEIYPLILNVPGLNNGVYHYHLKTHSLEVLYTPRDAKRKILSCFNQPWLREAAAICVISAVFWRTEVKYGERGYRNVLIETGALTQNLNLVANSLQLGTCSIGGYIDDGLHELIDLDGTEEAVVTVMSVGHKRAL